MYRLLNSLSKLSKSALSGEFGGLGIDFGAALTFSFSSSSSHPSASTLLCYGTVACL